MNKQLLLASAVVLAVSLSGAPLTAGSDTAALAKKITPSVVTIIAYNPDKAMPGLGTGFLVAPDRVVTARHVVAGVDRAEARTSRNRMLRVRGILAEDRAKDLVLLQLEAPVDGATVLKAAGELPAAGQELLAVSSPFGLEMSVSVGIVSGIRRTPHGGPAVQHTTAVSPGSSGCPLVNARGEVVAIQTGTITTRGGIVQAGQSLNFATPATALSSLKPGEARPLAQCRKDLPPGWVPPITRDVDRLDLRPFVRDDFQGALPFFEQAVRRDPEEPDAWFRLGLFREKTGDLDGAIEAYQKALRLHPDLPVALNNLGVVYLRKDRHADAAGIFRKALKLRGDYVPALAGLAEACNDLKEYRHAREAARKAVHLKPDHAGAHFQLGMAYARTGEMDKAREQYEMLLRLDARLAGKLKGLLGVRWSGAAPRGGAPEGTVSPRGSHLTALTAAGSPVRAARPNVLLIVTDQQHAGMLSCAGNRHLKTPALDGLAARGVRFERAYAANPVCAPSRVSMFTGWMPSRFGMRSNADTRNQVPESALPHCLGWLFRNAGYETVYGGKTHWLRGMTPRSIGFDPLTPDQRGKLADACADFLRRKRKKPFLLVASFINPHDICYMAIDDYTRATGRPRMYPRSTTEREHLAGALQMPEGVSRQEFLARSCPPLPSNFEVPEAEPECITDAYLGARSFRKYARDHWSAERWRMHRWAYCRLTETVDAHIGKVLRALRESGLERNTLVVFTSDHGDLDAAHRLEHKSILYEEAARVPLILAGPGVPPAARVDEEHLVSVGPDLIPTLCDFAGISPPPGLPGRSLRAIAEGRSVPSWRESVAVESKAGRMLRTARYKYVVYESGRNREQLIDLKKDPGEMRNLAGDPRYRNILDDHRRRLRRRVEASGDAIGKAYVPVTEDPRGQGNASDPQR